MEISKKNCSLRYPSIKSIDVEFEKRIDLVKNDILPRKIEEVIFFDVEYRMGKTVVDSIASKYSGSMQDYSDDESDEHFLIGMSACEEGYNSLICPCLQKVWETLKKEKISRKNIMGIYLLDMDRSEENYQKFIVLTKENIIYRWSTNKVEYIEYNRVIFTEDGLLDKSLIDGVDVENGRLVIRHYIDEQFYMFANELVILKCAVISDIGVLHPIGILPVEKRNEYLSFLVNAANAPLKIDAEKILKLEYLAKELGVSNQQFNKDLKDAMKGKIKDGQLGKKLSYIVLEVVPEEIRYVFYQEVLNLIINDGGEVLYDKLYKLLEKDSYAGKEFCKAYSEYVSNNRAACKNMVAVLASLNNMKIGNVALNIPMLFRKQKYDNEMNIQLLSIGVKMNG